MSTRVLWAVAAILCLTGFTVLHAGTPELLPWVDNRALANVLIVVALSLVSGITARRRRRARREDDPSSLEFQAHQTAAAQTLGDAMVFVSLLVLALVVKPTSTPVWWAVTLLVLLVADYWARYAAVTGSLRG